MVCNRHVSKAWSRYESRYGVGMFLEYGVGMEQVWSRYGAGMEVLGME